MKDLLKRLTSRKFLLTAGSMYLLAMNGQWTEFVAALGLYLTSEGASDVVTRVKQASGVINQGLAQMPPSAPFVAETAAPGESESDGPRAVTSGDRYYPPASL